MYDYRDLLELGRVTYNNISQYEEGWKTGETGGDNKSLKEVPSNEKNFLTLATELISTLKGNKTQDKPDGGGERSFLPWRFENPEGIKTKTVKGTLMRWCTNDCHPQPMWCGRKNCLNRADFAKKMEDSQKEGGRPESSKENNKEKGSGYNPSNDFKIALAAMCSEEDYETLERHFFRKTRRRGEPRLSH